MSPPVRVQRICRPRAAAGGAPRSGAARRCARPWRRRGRRAQVSAIATVFGLMLIVTFIANYLTTTLPEQMTVNDINHDLLVQNEAARLSSLLVEESLHPGTQAQLSQPFVLGSDGLPPFAVPDSGVIGPGVSSSSESVKFSLTGPFNPPSSGTPNKGNKGTCSVTTQNSKGKTTGLNCIGSTNVIWNFSAGDNTHYVISGNGGLGAVVNFSTNHSLISIGSVGGAINKVYVLGSYDTVYLNATGGAIVKVIVVGNHDTLTLSATGGGGYKILLVGNYDSVTSSSTGGAILSLVGYGLHDSFSGSGSGATFTVYYTGFNGAGGVSCPYSNGALTDTVGGAAGTVTYNDSTYTNAGHTGNASGWYYNYNNPSSANCPFVAVGTVATTSAGASFVVQLRNTYAPSAEVAYDFGAVAFAQYGGIPQMIDPPFLTYGGASATIWVPFFVAPFGEEAGTGTAIVSFQLTSITTQTFPSGGFSISSAGVTITVSTPYAAAWMDYLTAAPAFAGTASCAPAASAACIGPYSPGGALGKVTIQLPVTSVTLEIATYSLTLN